MKIKSTENKIKYEITKSKFTDSGYYWDLIVNGEYVYSFNGKTRSKKELKYILEKINRILFFEELTDEINKENEKENFSRRWRQR